MKFFNITGSGNPKNHYMLPATMRLDAVVLDRLIAQQACFVVYGPPKSGKSTTMAEFAWQLTKSEAYSAVLVSLEAGSAFPDDIGSAENAILRDWKQTIRFQLPKELQPTQWESTAGPGGRISEFLSNWSQEASRPLVVLMDDTDALTHKVLFSILPQLRSGFNRRPTGFPSSIVLIGLRDVHNYKIHPSNSPHLNRTVPFNIVAHSFALRNFNLKEVNSLLHQHTEETGQVFTHEALAHVFELSQGHPWLVNALAKICVEELVPDIAESVEIEHVETAKETIIQRRQTYLDHITDKLQDDDIRNVIEPILAEQILVLVPPDDREYAIDLGLVRRVNGGGLTIDNPIFKEVTLCELAGDF
ncbi:MAG: ATP-binding protein [Chloroflexota bacterium]